MTGFVEAVDCVLGRCQLLRQVVRNGGGGGLELEGFDLHGRPVCVIAARVCVIWAVCLCPPV